MNIRTFICKGCLKPCQLKVRYVLRGISGMKPKLCPLGLNTKDKWKEVKND